MKIAWETLAAAVLIAASILIIGRYQISAIGYGYQNGGAQLVYRLDRWTGHINRCTEIQMRDNSMRVECPKIDPTIQKM